MTVYRTLQWPCRRLEPACSRDRKLTVIRKDALLRMKWVMRCR